MQELLSSLTELTPAQLREVKARVELLLQDKQRKVTAEDLAMFDGLDMAFRRANWGVVPPEVLRQPKNLAQIRKYRDLFAKLVAEFKPDSRAKSLVAYSILWASILRRVDRLKLPRQPGIVLKHCAYVEMELEEMFPHYRRSGLLPVTLGCVIK